MHSTSHGLMQDQSCRTPSVFVVLLRKVTVDGDYEETTQFYIFCRLVANFGAAVIKSAAIAASPEGFQGRGQVAC